MTCRISFLAAQIGDEQNAQKEFGIARALKAASNKSDQELLKPQD